MCMGILFATLGLLALMMTSLRYNEDINDFLPLKGSEQKALSLYQDISGSEKVFVIFQMKDSSETNAELLAQAVDTFSDYMERGDGRRYVKKLTSQVDYDMMERLTDYVYDNIPLFLTVDDYAEMERRLSAPAFVEGQLQDDVQLLMMPSAGLFSMGISKDPLSLFSPVTERLAACQKSQPYETDNGYIYTQGGKCAVAMITTPYGAVESANNALLMDYADSVRMQTMQSVPSVDVALTGAPVIAVENARQIKADSFLAIAMSITLILALLIYSFRSFKDLLLIAFSILFGWMFALGLIANIGGNVSLIVLGIGSVIIGIAVNYPLHFVAHVSHGRTMREVLKDMVSPLLIGNVTTVGAFAALIPLDAPALRDLGLFAVLMLAGTILFVLIFLPHLAGKRNADCKERLSFGWLAEKAPERCRWVFPAIVIGTVVLGFFSVRTSFDADMHNINYMTPAQEELLSRLQTSAGVNDSSCVYVVTEGETWEDAFVVRERIGFALDSLKSSKLIDSYSDVSEFVCSKAEQESRIARWNDFWDKHREDVKGQIGQKSSALGFSDDAFSDFFGIISKAYSPQSTAHFELVKAALLPSSFSSVNGKCSVVETLQVPWKNIEKVKAAMNEVLADDGYAFDFVGMNSALANSLSDNFNYIGYACGIIVFVFLWLSFGRLELSLLAFLPMALGWIWILGLMQVLGMRFNIVNIILATFIFGQGDDYTIFMADGLINEYAYKRKLMRSYKNSIVISALIMFVGMGSLIVAKHPALHSLAEVTIVGMFTVVLMAWTVPPVIFKWIVSANGAYRQFPVTIEQVLRMACCATVCLFLSFYTCMSGLLAACIPCGKRKRERWHHRLICKSMRYGINHIGGLRPVVRNEHGEDFSRGGIIVCNHQSMLDAVYLLSLNPNIVMMAGTKMWRNPIVSRVLRFARFINPAQSMENLKSEVRQAVDDGYSVIVFPESCCSSDGKINRFHKGAFSIAIGLKTDILPVFIHGTGHVMPKHSGFISRGQATVEVGERIRAERLSEFGETGLQMARNMHSLYVEHYEGMKRCIEDSHYFHDTIIYKYMYKGFAVERDTMRQLRAYDDYCKWVDFDSKLYINRCKVRQSVIVLNSGGGQFPLLLSLVHPGLDVYSYSFDDDGAALASCCQHLPSNLHISKCDSVGDALRKASETGDSVFRAYLLFPDDEMRAAAAPISPVIVE